MTTIIMVTELKKKLNKNQTKNITIQKEITWKHMHIALLLTTC